MSILATKLYIPPPRPNLVLRPRLIERLNAGLHRKLTLLSAPAGFGKTTLVSSWISELRAPRAPANYELGVDIEKDSQIAGALGARPSKIVNPPVAWLSLDQGDNDPIRFLTYLVAALQTLAPQIGAGVLGVLQSPQPPRESAGREALLTTLLNEIVAIPDPMVLVLDDYHVIEAGGGVRVQGTPALWDGTGAVDQALIFLLDHLPPPLHLVIATREDPPLPLARLRARGQLTELRAADLRFTPIEAADFLNQVMGLKLTAEEVAALESRTEGWIAGLQLAALSLQGHQDLGDQDVAGFIQSFTGSHRFVLDYLVEEVLEQQPESVQTFLLRTSILDRLCGPLCDAVLGRDAGRGMQDEETSSSLILEALERANLFIVPLDNERRWYRYHQLFAELLRQRLQHWAAQTDDAGDAVAMLHRRASAWYEANGLEFEAFHHAVAANDVGRAERLIEGKGMPLHFRGAAVPILNWLKSLSKTVLDAWPALWTVYASVLLVTGQITGAEEKLQAAEAALQNAEPNASTLDLIGRIAAIRATAAATQNQIEPIIAYSRRALAYLHPDNLAFRTSTIWKLGYAYHLQGDRAAAGRAYAEVIAIGQASGNQVFTLLAAIGLGNIQELENQLHLAAETNRRILQVMGEQTLPAACVTYLGLARIHYEWNDLAAAQQYTQQALPLTQQLENKGQCVVCMVLLARQKLAQGDGAGATTLLVKAEQLAHNHNLVYQLPEVVAMQVRILLRQGQLTAAAQLAQTHNLPLSQVRVYLAQGNTTAALSALTAAQRQIEAKGWADERLRLLILQAITHHTYGNNDQAVGLLGDALALAAPEGFIRLFVDEGAPMARLLSVAAARGIRPDYIGKLLAALAAETPMRTAQLQPSSVPPPQPLIDQLSKRELEVLHLIAQGLSNHEISAQLFLTLSTVKGHNQRIFDKLQVQRRTEAVVRARALGLL